MNLLTNLENRYTLNHLPCMADGIESPVSYGAKAMRRKVHGFFYASQFSNRQFGGLKIIMVGDVWGSRKACRTHNPVSQPDISSTALLLITPDGGQSPDRSLIMAIISKQKTSLYRHYDADNQLLYVGISKSYIDRFESHKTTSEWAYLSVRMDMQWFESREEALAAEKHAIEHEHPKFNKVHSKINRINKINLSTTSEIFQFQNHPLRVFTDQEGNPWFIAKDVAEILEYSDANKMTKKLDDDEKSNRQIAGLGPGTGGKGITLINESGLYASVITSKKPEAKTFRRWVTHEVLPSIRKTGLYIKKPRELISDNSKKNLLIENDDLKRIKYLRKQLKEQEEQEEQERLERVKLSLLNPINLPVMIESFAADWQSGSLGAPFVPCLGEQVIRLFYRWFSEHKQFEFQDINDRSEIMTELYKLPLFDRQKICIDEDNYNQRVMVMINNIKPNNNFQVWINDCINSMENFFNN